MDTPNDTDKLRTKFRFVWPEDGDGSCQRILFDNPISVGVDEHILVDYVSKIATVEKNSE